MIASVFFAPGAGTLATCVGASEPPLVLRTATSLPSATNANLPSKVTTTPNGLLPRVTEWLWTWEIDCVFATATVHPGGWTAAVSPPPVPPLPVTPL